MPNLSNAQIGSNNEVPTTKLNPLESLNNRLESINVSLQSRVADLRRVTDRLFGEEPEGPSALREREHMPGQYGALETSTIELEISMGCLEYETKRLEDNA